MSERDLSGEAQASLRVNITLKGVIAKWALEIKKSGLATSNHDLVNQAIKALYARITNERLKIARLKTLENAGES
jgi:hypothetical protein